MRNRRVFKWRLKVRMLSHSRMSVGRDKRVPSGWNMQQQKKRDRPVRCVCEEWPAAEHKMSAEPEMVHGSAPAR